MTTPTDARRDAVAKAEADRIAREIFDARFPTAQMLSDMIYAALSVSDRYSEAERVREEAAKLLTARRDELRKQSRAMILASDKNKCDFAASQIEAVHCEIAAISLSPREPGAGSEDEADAESGSEFLKRMGDDASKWAAEFRKIAIKLGYGDMPEDWLIVWFANAIENSSNVRRWQREATLPTIPARGEADASVCKDSLRTGRDELGVAPSPSNPEDEALREAQKYLHKTSHVTIGITRLEEAIAIVNNARFGGDPGEIIVVKQASFDNVVAEYDAYRDAAAATEIGLSSVIDDQSARIAQLEAQVAADRAALTDVKVSGSRSYEHTAAFADVLIARSAYAAVVASLQPRSETP